MNTDIGEVKPTTPEEQFETILTSIRNDLDQAVKAKSAVTASPYTATRTQKFRWSLDNGKESDLNY